MVNVSKTTNRIRVLPNDSISASTNRSDRRNILPGNFEKITVHIILNVTTAMCKNPLNVTLIRCSSRAWLHHRHSFLQRLSLSRSNLNFGIEEEDMVFDISKFRVVMTHDNEDRRERERETFELELICCYPWRNFTFLYSAFCVRLLCGWIINVCMV